MTSSISLNDAPKEVRIEGMPILAIKKSITPRNGPIRMTANAIHLFAGSLLRGASGARRRFERDPEDPDSIRFNKSVATPESGGGAAAAIDNFISMKAVAERSNKKNSLLR